MGQSTRHIEPLLPLGPAPINRTITDSQTYSEALTRTAVISRTATESLSYSETPTRTGTFLRAATDSRTFADVVTRIGTLLRTTTDGVTYADVAARVGAFFRGLADNVTYGDVVTRTVTLLRTAPDSISHSEEVARIGDFLRDVVEALSTANDLAREFVGFRSAAVQTAAFPAPPRSESTGAQTTNSSTWTITYPASIVAGDLLMFNVATDGDPTVEANAEGFTVIGEPANADIVRGHTLAKVATGSETGSFTLNVSASEQGVWRMAAIEDWGGDLSAIEVSAGATGESANPDPPSFSPSWAQGFTFWRAIYAQDDGRGAATVYPDGYTIAQFSDSSGGQPGASMGSAGRQLEATTDDPTPFTSDRSDAWVAWVIAIRERPAIGDIVTLGDDLDRLVVVSRAVDDEIVLSDVVVADVAGTGISREVVDDLSYAEAVERAALLFRSGDDALSLSDVAAGGPPPPPAEEKRPGGRRLRPLRAAEVTGPAGRREIRQPERVPVLAAVSDSLRVTDRAGIFVDFIEEELLELTDDLIT